MSLQSNEFDHHKEDNPDIFLLSRSMVKTGSGRAVVCAVGNETRWYKEHPIEDLEDDNEHTPLQKKLEDLAAYIKNYAIILAAFTLISSLVFLGFKIYHSNDILLLSDETL